ncbi:hypothetical protein [Roseibium aggregatum]|uniref:Uncharacterized protein n=1 Tax=Roseibium aggregatum TaxID=187304 RepID=A0A0M6Y8X6_9HYPH|nr:hypothetical protein [Roseibium aggregatum]CTQ45727.1 hypothetical protein LAL4801_04182 [Roseibium aggregatum]
MLETDRAVVFYPADYVEDLARQLQNAEREISSLEQLRPHWAQGYTSDGVAAQAKTTALSQIWVALGVDNQTAAMERIRELLAREAVTQGL